MKRTILLLMLAAILFIAAWFAAWGARFFEDRRALIPFALLMMASLSIPIILMIDFVRWLAGRPTQTRIRKDLHLTRVQP